MAAAGWQQQQRRAFSRYADTVTNLTETQEEVQCSSSAQPV